jgi:asparagine synthase (glutamine-hydrolysing)
MASIAAVLTRSGVPERAVVERMLAAAPYRGSETAVLQRGQAAIGVNFWPDRPDATIASDPGLIVGVSGRITNAAELVASLGTAGHPPASAAAADVVLAAFRAYGIQAANRLRGEFAAVISDGRDLWCLRDHLGLKPLFYRDAPEAFFAGSDAKQVIAGADLERKPNLQVLYQIFSGRMPENMPSAFSGVDRLPKATILRVTNERAGNPERFWYPERLLETAKISPADVQPCFQQLFERAVSRSLDGADVVSLSGGIDSPAVAAFAARISTDRRNGPVNALSVVFPDFPTVDERPYIDLVVEHLGIPLHTYTLRCRALDDLEHWCDLFDGPVPTMNAPQMLEYYVEARRLGFSNVLTGDLAECVVDMQPHLAGHLFTHGRWGALARLLVDQRRQGASARNLAGQVLESLVPSRVAIRYLRMRGLDVPKRFPDWMDRNTLYEVPFREDLLVPGWKRWAAIQTMPLKGCPITMEAADVCAEVGGVRVSRPFGDIDLWEFFLSLPAEIKYPDLRSKTLLRALLRGHLPDGILDRRSKTFFDDHVMAQIDYPQLLRHLSRPSYELPGVDYGRLRAKLESRSLRLVDWIWVNDLTRVHAFLDRWQEPA